MHAASVSKAHGVTESAGWSSPRVRKERDDQREERDAHVILVSQYSQSTTHAQIWDTGTNRCVQHVYMVVHVQQCPERPGCI